MSKRRTAQSGSILIGVTVDYSLQFHNGLPELLDEAGWNVHIVSSPGPNLTRASRADGVTAHALPMARSPRPLIDFVSLCKWIGLLRRVRPNTILLGTPKASLLGSIAGWLLRVPRRIYVVHGLRYESAKGLPRLALRLMEKLTCAAATEVIAVSRSLERVIIDDRLSRPEKVRVIGSGSPNGVDTALFSPKNRGTPKALTLAEELGLDASTPVVGFVGRLTRDKGLPELASALKKLAERHVTVQVLTVGGIDDHTGAEGLELLKKSGQEIVNVEFTDDVWRYYSIMDVFCLPSLREGLSTVVLEAMASGVVVVGTGVTGIVDLVEDDVTGYLVPLGSADALADALATAISDDDRSGRLRTAALDRVLREFDGQTVRTRLRDYLVGDSGTR